MSDKFEALLERWRLGYITRETLRGWVKQAEIDAGQAPGVTTAEAQRIKELEAELGAVLGLSVGYVVKYNLDRRYVFAGTAA